MPSSGSSSPGTVSGTVRNVVLVHGAYADGSSWSEVIERLQGAGLAATAVQNPLTSLADDVAHTRRVLALQDGPTILAGHSFAGTVITEAGMDRAWLAWSTSLLARPTRVRTTPHWRTGSRRRLRTRDLSTPAGSAFRGRVPERFRQWRRPRPGAGPLCGARTRFGDSFQ